MYEFFEKRGKTFLVVIMAVLAIAFLLPSGFGGGGGRGTARLGSVDGKPIDVSDVQAAQNVIGSLERVLVPVPNRQGGEPQLTPLPQAVFGEALYRQFGQNPVHLYLLMREARETGAVPNDAQLDRFVADPVKFLVDGQPENMSRVTSAVKDALRNDLRQFFGIRESFQRAQSVLKISRPLLDDAIAKSQQQLKARVAAFDAADYEKSLPTPTADEVRKQFEAYRDVPPVASDANPFGFGYRVPDRLAVQWMVVPDAEVEKSVVAGRDAGRWEEQAIIYYREHISEFPATQPSATANASSTQPASKPAAKPYAEARADVLKALRGPLIEQKKREVAARVNQQMTAAYGKAATASSPATAPTTAPATQSSLAGSAFTFEGLNAIADAVQKQTGVRPTAVAPAGFLSREELAKQPGFGSTILIESQMNFTAGASYLFDSLKPLQKSDNATATLAVGQPTPAFLGNEGLYVARVVGVDPSHAGSLDGAKADAERDVRRNRAYDAANSAAVALLDKANAAGGLTKTDAKVETTDWFAATETAPKGLAGKWAAKIVDPAFDTLRGLTSASALPVRTLAKMRADGMAAVVEVFDVKTALTTKDLADARSQAEQTVAGEIVPRDFVQDWFAFDAVSRRTGYTPDAERIPANNPADPKNPNSPNNPANPLLPG